MCPDQQCLPTADDVWAHAADAQAVVVEGAEIVLEAPQPLALLLFSRHTSAFFKQYHMYTTHAVELLTPE